MELGKTSKHLKKRRNRPGGCWLGTGQTKLNLLCCGGGTGGRQRSVVDLPLMLQRGLSAPTPQHNELHNPPKPEKQRLEVGNARLPPLPPPM